MSNVHLLNFLVALFSIYITILGVRDYVNYFFESSFEFARNTRIHLPSEVNFGSTSKEFNLDPSGSSTIISEFFGKRYFNLHKSFNSIVISLT